MRTDSPSLEFRYFDETPLEFAGRREHLSQRLGIARFGPYSLDSNRHPENIRLGMIGTGASVASVKKWLENASLGIAGDADHDSFPGSAEDRGFFARLQFDDEWCEAVTTHELDRVTGLRRTKERFEQALALLEGKLRLLSERDHPPAVVVLALPEELLKQCTVADYNEPGVGLIHRDLRRSLKAAAMQYRIPTQIILPKVAEATAKTRNLDHPSRIAWNLFTALYFKAGGIPWAPTSLRPATCYVGISFFRSRESDGRMHTSIAQAFDEHGDGIVLRGHDFLWDEEALGKSPHLEESTARSVMELVLRRYREELKQLPVHVVVHKSSSFWNEERRGFSAALQSVNRFDLVTLRPTSELRLLRPGQYPALRGTSFSVGEAHGIYTTGFIPSLNRYPHGHVPSPLLIAEHHGDSSLNDLCRDILVLSRMNWNSAAFAGLMPITLRFSRLVGDVMREVPTDREPLPQYKYYI